MESAPTANNVILIHTVGDGGLTAVRSRSGKNNTPCCFLRPSRRFATPTVHNDEITSNFTATHKQNPTFLNKSYFAFELDRRGRRSLQKLVQILLVLPRSWLKLFWLLFSQKKWPINQNLNFNQAIASALSSVWIEYRIPIPLVEGSNPPGWAK